MIQKSKKKSWRFARSKAGKTKAGSGDFFLTALVMILVIFGVIMVFSASYYTALNKQGTPYYYLERELMYAGSGLLFFFGLAMIDYHKLIKHATLIYILAVLLVMLTYSPVGASYNNAARWIQIGSITIIPGEFAKLGLIIFSAWWLTKKPERINEPVHGLLPLLALSVLVVVPVYLQPSTTTAMTILLILVGILFVAGIRFIYLILLGAAGGGAVLLHMIQESGSGYRSSRIASFLDPFADAQGSGYQVVQGLYALASGGIKGLGLGNSIQKNLYLPDPQNDFILAIIGEELGYIGLLVLLAVYLLLIWRCTKIALSAPDAAGMLTASGITIMLAIQVILNVMVVTSLMPPTGIALPFISYGGTAMWLFMMAMGIMLSISRRRKPDSGEE